MIRWGEGKRQDVLGLGCGAGHAGEATSPRPQKSIDEATLGYDGLRSLRSRDHFKQAIARPFKFISRSSRSTPASRL
jgi:hypothetical protein